MHQLTSLEPTLTIMKLAILALVLAVAAALPQEDVTIVRSSNVQNEDGSFEYGYETSDGQTADVTGESKAVGPEGEVGTVMSGSYSFVGLDGVTYTVTWVADENGFQAEGDHLPKPVDA